MIFEISVLWRLCGQNMKKFKNSRLSTDFRKKTLNNFTDGENQKTIVVLSCSAEFTAAVQGELIFLSIVNIFLSITAVLGDTLIPVALHKETLLHPPFKLLYRNLAVTDFCVRVRGVGYHFGASKRCLLDFCGDRENEIFVIWLI